MQGSTSVIPNNILTRTHSDVEDRIAVIVVKSRLVTGYELDLNKREVNMSIFKKIRGSDFIKVGELMSKAVCSLAIAADGLPNVDRQPEFASDALSRRIISLRMEVDTADVPFEPDPTRGLDKVDFHCACLYIRIYYSHLPISPDNLLLSLCMSSYFWALELVDVEHTGEISGAEGRAVIPVIAAMMGSEPYRILERCRLISMSSISATVFGDVIKGMRPRRGGRPR